MLSEFFFLAWKKNLSSIFISQRFMSIPIDIRELTNYIFKCRKYYDLDWIHFIAIKQKQKGKELEDIQEFEIKNLDLMDYNGIEYNTLQESKIKKEDWKNKKKKKIKKKIIKKIDKKKKSI
jgi:hypothetical protein